MFLARLQAGDGRYITDVAIPLAIAEPAYIELDGHYFQRHGSIERDDGVSIYRYVPPACVPARVHWSLPSFPN
jgi:hypothetical protein